MRKLTIQNTSFRDEKILLVHPDQSKAAEIEARFEQDPQFSGLNFYTANSFDEARDLIKGSGIQLAIYPDGLDGRDFVSIQQEFVHASSEIKLIPLLAVPSITQLRESKRIGGVIDYGEIKDIGNVDIIIQLVWGYLREQKALSLNSAEIFARTSSIQSALLIDHKDWSTKKQVSGALLTKIIPLYDLSPVEALNLVAAEQLYFPWIDESGYSSLLKGAAQEFSETLRATASWERLESKPKSIQGFLITLVNFIAEQSIKSTQSEALIQSIMSRPHFLMHAAIRVISSVKLNAILIGIADQAEGSLEKTS